MNEQSERLIIDLSQGDRAQSYPKEQRLQRAAYDDVMVSLKRCTRQAQEFTRAEVSSDDGHLRDKIYRSRGEMMRIHNAIFVGGERGVGKTAFMLNIENVWKEEGGEKEKGSLHFTPPIDPTLIRVEDNFLNIIVSQIYKDVRPHVQRSPSQDFWNAFDELGAALEAEQAVSDNDLRGVDRILKHRDHADLEQKLNRFFEIACGLLKVDAIVVLIDDVDMSLTKGFDILDTVRRYLSCPLIIPVISGDIALYESLVLKYFAKELGVDGQIKDLKVKDLRPARESGAGVTSETADDLKNGLLRQAKILGQEYLKKVLPIHQRVVLKTIPDLSHQLQIRHLEWASPVPFEELMAVLAAKLASPANGEEGSQPEIRLRTAREVIQFLELVGPHMKIASIGNSLDIDIRPPGIFRRMVEYGRLTLDTELEYRFEADVMISGDGGRPLSRLADVRYFNPRLHQQDIAFYPLQQRVDDPRERMRSGIPAQPLDQLPRAVMAMPSPEPINRELLISSEELALYSSGDCALLIDIFTHRAYYSSFQKSALLFFGRAFEIIFSNLMGITDTRDMQKIINSAPFYTDLFFFPTKTVDINMGDGDEDESQEIVYDLEKYDEFFSDITDWYSINEFHIKSNLSSYFIYKVMNKFFAQINLYKNKRAPLQGDLRDQILRFKLILLNACASLESRESRIVQQNIALNSLTAYEKDSSWQINVLPLLHDDAGLSLTKILSEHPLFSLVDKAAGIPITGASARIADSVVGPNQARRNARLERRRNRRLQPQEEARQRVDKVLEDQLDSDLRAALELEISDVPASQVVEHLKRIATQINRIDRLTLADSILNRRGIYTKIRGVLRKNKELDKIINELASK